jgi:diadenosine tetraphosphate (Ap4A) HIT family hydrolase
LRQPHLSHNYKKGYNILFDHPRSNEHVIFIAQLQISSLLLFRDQRFRGYSILSFDPWDATSLESLSDEEYSTFMADLRDSSRAIRQALNPDHMNYELLGNTNPHLHWHIIPRFKDDPRWGQPIWEGYPRNEFTINRHTLSDTEYHDIVMQIRQSLAI